MQKRRGRALGARRQRAAPTDAAERVTCPTGASRCGHAFFVARDRAGEDAIGDRPPRRDGARKMPPRRSPARYDGTTHSRDACDRHGRPRVPEPRGGPG